MTPEVINTMLAAVSTVATIFGGMYVMLRRLEGRIDARFERVDAQFERVDAQFARVDARFDKVDERFDRIEAEIVDLKVAVARIEGPQRSLLPARG